MEYAKYIRKEIGIGVIKIYGLTNIGIIRVPVNGRPSTL